MGEQLDLIPPSMTLLVCMLSWPYFHSLSMSLEGVAKRILNLLRFIVKIWSCCGAQSLIRDLQKKDLT